MGEWILDSQSYPGMCVCVCVCVRERERAREGGIACACVSERKRVRETDRVPVCYDTMEDRERERYCAALEGVFVHACVFVCASE